MIVPLLPVRWNCGSLRQYSCGKETGYYRSHHPARGRIDEEGGDGAPIERGWESVVFKPSRDLGEVREVEFLGIFERTHVGRMGLISARWCFFSEDVASGQWKDRVFERKYPLFTLLPAQEV